MTTFRPLEDRDVAGVIALWTDCGLVRAWNDPRRDIDFARGKENSEILVGIADGGLVSSVLVGHDGHRGWLYYVSVAPASQGKGLGKATVRAAEAWLKARGIWAINLNIRSENAEVRGFYAALGYELRDVIVMGRRDLDL
ncbi:GNAT family acetyltransferase [Taklimakanibacter deserti]|uniref:GNAT family acetyltransferase n=1 Tax=Taklimakanibacter deserti TaxID=2267839 RepID=UPI000E649F46